MTPHRRVTTSFITLLLITWAAPAVSGQWPVQSQYDTSGFETRFERLAEDPESTMTIPGLLRCEADRAKLTKFTRSDLSTVQTMVGQGSEISDYELSYIELYSTDSGCRKFDEEPLNVKLLRGKPHKHTLPAGNSETYLVRLAISYTINIPSGNDTISVKIDQETRILRRLPSDPVDPALPVEQFVWVKDKVNDITTFALNFVQPETQADRFHTIALSSNSQSMQLIYLANYDQAGRLLENTYVWNDALAQTTRTRMIDGTLDQALQQEQTASIMKLMQRKLESPQTKANAPMAEPARDPNREKFLAERKASKCNLTNPDWVYTGTACKGDLAHGKGEAIDAQGLRFIGTFDTGKRTEGEIHRDGDMIFSGSFKDDKPDGEAICFHEGEFEECRFFRGKRIDTLYKIRKENAKMQAKMEQMNNRAPTQAAGTRSKDIGDYAVDALQREATDRAADFIFDKLF